MHRYLYIFSYQTPKQSALADQVSAEESCEAFFIFAESADQALAWGRDISEQFVRQLFGETGKSWKAQDFANWVESEPEKEYPAEVLQTIKSVSYGEFPSF